MSFAQTVLLAAFAGGTIFLGLPVGRLRGLSREWQAALTTAAGGVILFLIYDVLAQAVEPVEEALDDGARRRIGRASSSPTPRRSGFSVAVGLLSVTYLTSRMAARQGGGVPITPRQVALGTAVGLGLHNFSEGLAIGQSAATGATAFAADPGDRLRPAQRHGGLRDRGAAGPGRAAELELPGRGRASWAAGRPSPAACSATRSSRRSSRSSSWAWRRAP